MPARKRQQKKPEKQHIFLSVRVESYGVETEVSVNRNVYEPQYAWGMDDDDPLYEFVTRLKITGTFLSPEERAGEMCELTLYSGNSSPHRIDATLKDAQSRDKFGSPAYRMYRGKQIPVFEPPKGLGRIEKLRARPCWTSWLPVQSQFVADTLVLLGHGRLLFLAVHERREKREHWIQSLSLQTNNPEEEE
jgi:hypothetical protein